MPGVTSRGRVSGQGYVRLLRSPVVRGLWIAQVQSVVGDRLYALAMMWLIWQVAHSPFLMGLGAVAESVPYIAFGTVFKRYLGRFASLRRLAAVDMVRAVIVGAVPLLWGSRVTEVAALLSAAFLLGVLGALFEPNLGALVPELAEPEQVQQVTGLMDLTGRVARAAGPGTAGLLLLVVPAVGLYGVDAVTFAVSAVLLLRVSRYAPADSRAAEGKGKQAAGPRAPAGVLLRRSPQLAVVIAVHGIGTLASTLPAIAMPVLLTVRLHATGTGYGLVLAAAGLGALAGNPLAGSLRAGSRFPAAYFTGYVATGLTLIATGQARSLAVVAAVTFAGGLLAPVAAISLRTHLGRAYVASERLGIIAVDQAVIRTAGTAGMLVLPALAASNPGAGFTVAGLVTVLAAVAGLLVTGRLAGPAGASEQPAPAGSAS
jgi:hypothetical protein